VRLPLGRATRREEARTLLRVMEAKMSQSRSGAPGWQLEGNAPLAYDTHIVDGTTRADLWKSPQSNRAIACWTSRAALVL
jgi:hypothetical protein